MAGLTENRLSVCKHFFPADIKRISQGTWSQATDRPWLSCAKGKVLKGCGGFRAIVGLEGQAWKIEPTEGAWEGWAAGSTARLQREHCSLGRRGLGGGSHSQIPGHARASLSLPR